MPAEINPLPSPAVRVNPLQASVSATVGVIPGQPAVRLDGVVLWPVTFTDGSGRVVGSQTYLISRDEQGALSAVPLDGGDPLATDATDLFNAGAAFLAASAAYAAAALGELKPF